MTDNLYAYGAPKHRHLGEIEQELSLAAGHPVRVTFVPHVAPLHRGMATSITARLKRPTAEADLQKVLRDAYRDEPFIELTGDGFPQARRVANSNRIEIAAKLDARTNRLLLFSALDNLGKGNASQAIQAANLAFGLPETTGIEG
jgi:N-acetyl-gamma-glutamyl-phosphate reductase